ncbi:MAG TPA: NADH-quinone oxidoreductase subunit NuoN [Corynebacteriales bacterium]|nr:NADH-quinone oxidoreductase subunit NuoN [Mycobacteriales bacterium]
MIQYTLASELLAQQAAAPAEMLSNPSIEYLTLAPLLIVLGGAFLAIILEAAVPRAARAVVQMVVSAVTLIAAFSMLVVNWVNGNFSLAASGMLAIDKASYLVQGALIIFGAMSLLLFTSKHSRNLKQTEESRSEYTEIYAIALFSLFGMMLFASANNLLMLFVALEIMSLPLYVLTALAYYRRQQAQEASLKYFLLGVLAAAIMLYGIVFLYAATGSLSFAAIAEQSASTAKPSLLLLGIMLVVIGLLFKVGAVPFHSWVPDVYQGAPTPVTAFMAICTKLAAVAALARILTIAVPLDPKQWDLVIIALAIVSMIFGALVTMTQTNIKRLIAYSSITHAGFIIVALVGANRGLLSVAGLEFSVISAILVYLVAYGLATIGAFAIVTLVRKETGEESTAISSWAGLGREHPWLGAAFALFFLSLAGFPITAGFIGKFTVFAVPWLAGYSWLVVVALLVSALAAYAYVRVIIVMFFHKPENNTVVSMPNVAVGVVVILTAVLTVLMGILPGPVLGLLNEAGMFMM